MTHATIRIPTPLRAYTDGADEVAVEAADVREALESLAARCEGIRDKLLDEEGRQRGFVNLFVGSRELRDLDGLDTQLAEGDVVSILPAVAGGRR